MSTEFKAEETCDLPSGVDVWHLLAYVEEALGPRFERPFKFSDGSHIEDSNNGITLTLDDGTRIVEPTAARARTEFDRLSRPIRSLYCIRADRDRKVAVCIYTQVVTRLRRVEISAEGTDEAFVLGTVQRLAKGIEGYLRRAAADLPATPAPRATREVTETPPKAHGTIHSPAQLPERPLLLSARFWNHPWVYGVVIALLTVVLTVLLA